MNKFIVIKQFRSRILWTTRKRKKEQKIHTERRGQGQRQKEREREREKKKNRERKNIEIHSLFYGEKGWKIIARKKETEKHRDKEIELKEEKHRE